MTATGLLLTATATATLHVPTPTPNNTRVASVANPPPSDDQVSPEAQADEEDSRTRAFLTIAGAMLLVVIAMFGTAIVRSIFKRQ